MSENNNQITPIKTSNNESIFQVMSKTVQGVTNYHKEAIALFRKIDYHNG